MSEAWWRGGVFYQIYPRSFKDTSGNGVGDLKGITRKLEYIASLGVEGVWISPFFQSPMKDFGYDVSDYRAIDPLFGEMADFDALLGKAHTLGLKIIIDMVLSHTSDQHAWFQDPAKKDWYVWADAKPDLFEDNPQPPNNWVSVFGGSAWEWDERYEQYYFHNFLKEQPDLNYHNRDVQEAILKECRFWLDKGVDGLRLDVINFIFHDAELRDNPMKNADEGGFATQLEKPDPYNDQHHIYDKSRPEALVFVEKFRAMMEEHPGTFTLAEIGDDDASTRAAEYTDGDNRFHTAYSFALMTGDEITPERIRAPVLEQLEKGPDSWPSWAFCNHDVHRVVSRWGDKAGHADYPDFAKMLIALLCSLRGTAFLYQGEELGLPEATLQFEDLEDPWGKHHWPKWPGRDGCRTPMPWDSDAPHAGFSDTSDKPWLPIPKSHTAKAVSAQENDPSSPLNFARKFLHWRKTQNPLIHGDITFSDEDTHILTFTRTYKGEIQLCLFNLSGNVQTFTSHALEQTLFAHNARNQNNEITLEPYGVFFGSLSESTDTSSCDIGSLMLP